MRIVGGAHRGVGLVAPRGDRTRPTSDRLRETIFNVLVHRGDAALARARVLDLFAGTGALGLEALSRGAEFALFVEIGAEARAAIRRNAEALGATGRTRIWKRDATRLGPCTLPPFAIAFADPPYGEGLGVAALAGAQADGWLAPGAVAVLEERADALPDAIPGFALADRRTVGDSAFAIFVAAGPPSTP